MYVKGEPVLSDFGLMSFPDKSARSGDNEKIGPQWTIAPEMKRTSSTAEFKKSDIYSLANSLWILITGSKFGFEGQYVPNSNISVRKLRGSYHQQGHYSRTMVLPIDGYRRCIA
ncbi:hypothetical protein ASG14_16400 [Pedobacter sp. Leaf194]|nr:hypothetical protein ASG14_16400 [Pedobacter sp. Leaf194]